MIVPRLHGLKRRRSIEGAVDLHRPKARGIERQPIRLRSASGYKDPRHPSWVQPDVPIDIRLSLVRFMNHSRSRANTFRPDKSREFSARWQEICIKRPFGFELRRPAIVRGSRSGSFYYSLPLTSPPTATCSRKKRSISLVASGPRGSV